MRTGIIGCGAIGGFLEEELSADERFTDIFIYDIEPKKPKFRGQVVSSIDEMISSGVDLVVEAASRDSVFQYGEKILSNGIDLMVLSVGALLDEELNSKLKAAAAATGKHIYVPVGAIGGVDAIQSAGTKGLKSVSIRSTKRPASFKRDDKERTVIFEGSASEAVLAFPKNINVSAILTLASGLGGDNVSVEIVSDPAAKRTHHEITVVGDFGQFASSINNFTMPANPGTSYMAALSTLALLKKFVSIVQIG